MEEKHNEDEFGELLIGDMNESNNEKVEKEIDVNIFNFQSKNIENYKLLDDAENIILCKEDKSKEIKSIKESKKENIKIKEFYDKQEGDSFYYLNKKEIKKKFLINILNIEKYYENSLIDNTNEKEIEEIYNKVQLKHPRLIINNKITKYPFFSWSGFFCCNKSDYLALGQLYLTYFNTIKLLILFFFLISLIQIFSINHYSKYKTVYNFGNDMLLKTTLGNTIISYFNTTIIQLQYGTDYNYDLSLYCGENIVLDIVAIRRFFNVGYKFSEKIKSGIISKELYNYKDELTSDLEKTSHPFSISYNKISSDFLHITEPLYNNNGYFLYIAENNQCVLKLNYLLYQNYIRIFSNKNTTDIFFYSCLEKDNFNNYNGNKNHDIIYNDVRNKRNQLWNTIFWTTLLTLILIIIFYYAYKKSISKDNKEYQKNKFIINDYTLVLHNLKIISEDYEQELSDLISFLNTIITTHKQLFLPYLENYDEINDTNIFDISISNVNKKKIETFEKIKSLQNKIEDITKDNDTLKSKIKKNIKGIYHSIQNIVANLSDKDENIKENENDNNIINDEVMSDSEEILDTEKQTKINKKLNEIKELKNNITIEITKMHKEYSLKYYGDIYITFKNQILRNLIYELYNKGKMTRFLYYIFCQKEKLSKYYYKNQWLNFDLAKDNPSDIKWENYYISSKSKYGRRILSLFLSLVFIILIAFLMIVIKRIEDNINSIIIVIITQIIGVASEIVLKKIAIFEKYSSQSKEIFSTISKVFWLNLLISLTIFFKNDNIFIFSYLDIEDYFILNKVIIMNMIFTIFTSQISPLLFYILNLLKRYGDSKHDNGKTTQLTDKKEYEKIYIGPEFPFSERYAKILVNLSICFLYGANCPIIYIFFLVFLIVTFIVDKYLMINYYRKPPLYGNILSEKILNYFFFSVFLFIYGTFYNLSNPYLLHNEYIKTKYAKDNNSDSTNDIFLYIYYFINPFTIFYIIYSFPFDDRWRWDIKYFYFNYNSQKLLAHSFFFVVMLVNPASFIKKKLSPKNKIISFLNISSTEIGKIYSFEDLKKYYEIKKLQLFNLIFDCDKENKKFDNCTSLINNYLSIVQYIKRNIDEKSKSEKDIIEINNEKDDDESLKLKGENLIESAQLKIYGDTSYNQSFINKYEIYNNYSLVKNL